MSKVQMQWPMFEALAKGYLASATFLSPAEKAHLAFAGWLMTFEVGLRFLSDHLAGDIYFKVHREGHNLDRARTQFALARDIEKNLGKWKNWWLAYEGTGPGAREMWARPRGRVGEAVPRPYRRGVR